MTSADDDDDFFWQVTNTLEVKYEKTRFQAGDFDENSCEYWLVDFDRVAIRDAPSTKTGKIVDGLRKGALLHVASCHTLDPGNGNPGERWIRLADDELRFFKSSTKQLWLLVDADAYGHGKLLRGAPNNLTWANDDGMSLFAVHPKERAKPAARIMSVEYLKLMRNPHQNPSSKLKLRPSSDVLSPDATQIDYVNGGVLQKGEPEDPWASSRPRPTFDDSQAPGRQLPSVEVAPPTLTEDMDELVDFVPSISIK